MGFHKLIDIIQQAQSRFPALAKRMNEAYALGRWEKAVGPVIARHSRAIRVQDEVLWVEVDHPIWKAELHHRKRQILDILNQRAREREGDSVALKDILFLEPRGRPRRGREGWRDSGVSTDSDEGRNPPAPPARR